MAKTVRKGNLESKVILAALVPMDRKERLATKETRAQLESRDLLDHKVHAHTRD